MKLVRHIRVVQGLALAGALVASAGFVHASTIAYNLIGATTSAGSLTGMVTIDTTTDLITAANITFHDSLIGNPVFTQIGSPNTYNGLGQDYISGLSNGPLNYGGQIALYYDTANIGLGDLGICLAIGPCGTETNQASSGQGDVGNGYGGPFNLTGGSLRRVSTVITSEPEGLVLLGTGILGIAVLSRLKVFRA